MHHCQLFRFIERCLKFSGTTSNAHCFNRS